MPGLLPQCHATSSPLLARRDDDAAQRNISRRISHQQRFLHLHHADAEFIGNMLTFQQRRHHQPVISAFHSAAATVTGHQCHHFQSMPFLPTVLLKTCVPNNNLYWPFPSTANNRTAAAVTAISYTALPYRSSAGHFPSSAFKSASADYFTTDNHFLQFCFASCCFRYYATVSVGGCHRLMASWTSYQIFSTSNRRYIIFILLPIPLLHNTTNVTFLLHWGNKSLSSFSSSPTTITQFFSHFPSRITINTVVA